MLVAWYIIRNSIQSRCKLWHNIYQINWSEINGFYIWIEKAPANAPGLFDIGAGDRVRTDDVQLGKLTFYH